MTNDSFEKLKFDRGLHYGDGLFETIAVKSGKAELLDEHLERLQKSCIRLRFTNVDFLQFKNDVNKKAEEIKNGVIKLIVTRGSGGRGYSISNNMPTRSIILHYPWPDYSIQNWINGISIKKCELVLATQPLLAGMKHLNRLENVMARFELDTDKFQEGILCDSTGNVIEATSSNVFLVKNNVIITPTLEGCGVSGVMRKHLIDEASKNNYKIEIKNVSFKALLNADEVFLTNSIIGIWPVANLNERMYFDFSVTKKLMALLDIKIDE